jgi:DNA-binding CsgD family transcriptional regulator
MSATLTKPELEATPANASAIRPFRINVAAAVATLREALSLQQRVEDPLVISIVPGLSLVLLADRLTTEVMANLAGAMAVLEEGEREVLAPVLGTVQTRPPDRNISPREREVLALVIAGHSNKEIATALFVSPNTIKTHVTSLLNKLDADNRAHLAVIGMQCGLIAH